MSNTDKPRRQIRLTEILPTPYVAQAPEGDRYTPPPPDPDDGPRRRSFRPPRRPLGVLTFGEACLVYAETHEDAMDGWRANFPESADVHDGVHVTEAGVDVQWITDETDTDEEADQ